MLITSLANAHRDLILDTSGDSTLASTARKIESTLIGLIKALTPDAFTREVTVALLNSGSLKAVKLAPITDKVYAPQYGAPGPDAKFILSQPKTYVRETLKRGFGLDDARKLDIIKAKADGQSSDISDDMLTQDGLSAHMVDQLLGFTLDLDKEKGARIAGLVSKLLSKSLKTHGEVMKRDLETYCVIHDPEQAGPLVFKAIIAHALMGTKKPKQTAIEHQDVEGLVKDIFSTTGRTALKKETGGLEAWIAAGCPAPKAIHALEQKRKSAPRRQSYRRF